MANVLSELFSGIADAIRGKTGSTDKMAPADFPAAIEAIEIDNGTYAEVKWVSNTGTFKATSAGQSVVIEHGLGVVPDFIAIASGVGATLEAGKEHYPELATYVAAGWHSDLVEQIEHAYKYQCSFGHSFESGTTYGGFGGGKITGGSSGAFIRYANATTFEIGKDGFGAGVLEDVEYRWIAVGHK
jgi:hypothetical protein